MIFDKIVFAKHLQEEEQLLFVVHNHWIIFLPVFFKVSFFGIFLPVMLWILFPKIFLVAMGWVIFGGLRLFYDALDWYLDAILVTNLGVIDLDWRGIFSKSSNRIEYEAMIGVEQDKHGFWSHIFDFGVLVIARDGHGGSEISLPYAHHPAAAEEQILEIREQFMHHHTIHHEESLKEILSQMVAKHVREEREKENRGKFW